MKIREAAPIRDVIVAKISPLVTIDDTIITRLDIDHKQISKIDNDLKMFFIFIAWTSISIEIEYFKDK